MGILDTCSRSWKQLNIDFFTKGMSNLTLKCLWLFPDVMSHLYKHKKLLQVSVKNIFDIKVVLIYFRYEFYVYIVVKDKNNGIINKVKNLIIKLFIYLV